MPLLNEVEVHIVLRWAKTLAKCQGDLSELSYCCETVNLESPLADTKRLANPVTEEQLLDWYQNLGRDGQMLFSMLRKENKTVVRLNESLSQSNSKLLTATGDSEGGSVQPTTPTERQKRDREGFVGQNPIDQKAEQQQERERQRVAPPPPPPPRRQPAVVDTQPATMQMEGAVASSASARLSDGHPMNPIAIGDSPGLSQQFVAAGGCPPPPPQRRPPVNHMNPTQEAKEEERCAGDSELRLNVSHHHRCQGSTSGSDKEEEEESVETESSSEGEAVDSIGSFSSDDTQIRSARAFRRKTREQERTVKREMKRQVKMEARQTERKTKKRCESIKKEEGQLCDEDRAELNQERAVALVALCFKCGGDFSSGEMRRCNHCQNWGHEICGGPHPDTQPAETFCAECRDLLGIEDPNYLGEQDTDPEDRSTSSDDSDDSSLSGFVVDDDDIEWSDESSDDEEDSDGSSNDPSDCDSEDSHDSSVQRRRHMYQMRRIHEDKQPARPTRKSKKDKIRAEKKRKEKVKQEEDAMKKTKKKRSEPTVINLVDSSSASDASSASQSSSSSSDDGESSSSTSSSDSDSDPTLSLLMSGRKKKKQQKRKKKKEVIAQAQKKKVNTSTNRGKKVLDGKRKRRRD